MEKSGFKIHFHFLQFTKKAQKIWSRIPFYFVNVARFARKHFLMYPKLVGTPCNLQYWQLLGHPVALFLILLKPFCLRAKMTLKCQNWPFKTIFWHLVEEMMREELLNLTLRFEKDGEPQVKIVKRWRSNSFTIIRCVFRKLWSKSYFLKNSFGFGYL